VLGDSLRLGADIVVVIDRVLLLAVT